jgi:hypothetical protein
MWIRKSQAEIQSYLNEEEAKRKSLLRPLVFSFVLSVVVLILYQLGYRGGWLSRGMVLVSNPRGIDVRTVFTGVFFFAFFFALALYRQRRRTLYSAGDSLLCRECTRPAHANPSAICQCGGRLEPFAYFTWSEDDVTNRNEVSAISR